MNPGVLGTPPPLRQPCGLPSPPRGEDQRQHKTGAFLPGNAPVCCLADERIVRLEGLDVVFRVRTDKQAFGDLVGLAANGGFQLVAEFGVFLEVSL